MNHEHKKQQGFTIIELTLAMTFISFLLLGIALTIIQMGAIYNQGTTSKEINQASRDMDDDISRNISSASPLTLADDYVLTPSVANPAGGRLCLGTYSYVWNYSKAISSGATGVTKYETIPAGSDPDAEIRFVRVPDPGKVYCALKTDGSGAVVNPKIRTADSSLTQELLKPGDHELGIHNFSFISPVPASSTDSSTGQQIYSLTYTIGTSKISALNPTQSACLAPNLANADPLYCNIQQFNLVVRAGNGVN